MSIGYTLPKHNRALDVSILKEFKDFATRGNVIDLAVCVIIGAAFGKIVSSMVEDLLMPLIGAIPFLQADFSNLYIPLAKNVADAVTASGSAGLPLLEAKKIGPVFAYGNFLSITINFLIVSGAIFTLIKTVNKLKHQDIIKGKGEPSADVKLLTEIRDLLKDK